MLNFASKNKEKDEMLENIRMAHRQWEERIIFFQSVTDPDLVDYAIFEMEASKLKYIYLLKQYKSGLADEKLMENAIS